MVDLLPPDPAAVAHPSGQDRAMDWDHEAYEVVEEAVGLGMTEEALLYVVRLHYQRAAVGRGRGSAPLAAARLAEAGAWTRRWRKRTC